MGIREYKEKYLAKAREYKAKNKEHIKEKNKEYWKTEKGQMISKIATWERRGIIYPNIKELYYIYKMTTHCNYCWVELVEGLYGFNKKCLDHDHNTGEPRGVICQTCNLRDVFATCVAPSENE